MKSNLEYTFSLSLSSLIQIILLALGVIIIIQFKDIVVLFILAFIISSGIMLGSKGIQKKLPISYLLGVLLIVALLLAFVTLLMVLIVPALSNEFQNLVTNFPRFVNDLNQIIRNITGLDGFNLRNYLDNQTSNVPQYAWDVVTGVFFTTRNIINSILYIGFLLVTTFYMVVKPQSFDELIIFFFPAKKSAYITETIQKARVKVGSWILGQCIISLILTGVTYAFLLILNVPYALLLAVIAGFFNIIPFIGPLFGMIPAIIFALFKSVEIAVIVGLFYLGIQQFDGHILTPMIMRKVTGLHSLVIVLGILIGASLVGALGALIAVPIISVLSLFVKELEA